MELQTLTSVNRYNGMLVKLQFILFTVTGAESMPKPGWINGFKGLNMVLGRQATGQLRCWKVDRNAIIDIIPVDHVANLLIAVAWDVCRSR